MVWKIGTGIKPASTPAAEFTPQPRPHATIRIADGYHRQPPRKMSGNCSNKHLDHNGVGNVDEKSPHHRHDQKGKA